MIAPAPPRTDRGPAPRSSLAVAPAVRPADHARSRAPLAAATYRHLRANFTYDVIPIALFQAPIYVTSATEVLM